MCSGLCGITEDAGYNLVAAELHPESINYQYIKKEDFMARLSKEEIGRELGSLIDWQLDGDSIVKVFKFPDFVRAMGFVQSTALLAEKQDHHPDIDVRWNKVTLRFTTHSEGGLTKKDFKLAKDIDSLPV